MDEEEEMAMMGELEQPTVPTVEDRSGFEAEADDVPMRPVEKKRLDWRGKTYLAPLTTVGNLVSRAAASHSQLANPFTALPATLCRLWRRHHVR